MYSAPAARLDVLKIAVPLAFSGAVPSTVVPFMKVTVPGRRAELRGHRSRHGCARTLLDVIHAVDCRNAGRCGKRSRGGSLRHRERVRLRAGAAAEDRVAVVAGVDAVGSAGQGGRLEARRAVGDGGVQHDRRLALGLRRERQRNLSAGRRVPGRAGWVERGDRRRRPPCFRDSRRPSRDSA